MAAHFVKKLWLVLALFVCHQMLFAQNAIRLNQLGFYPQAQKYAVAVNAAGSAFFVLNATQTDTVWSGLMGATQIWSHSNESVKLIDLTALQQPGKYVLDVPGLGRSHPFLIADYVQQGLAVAAMKGYYFQRVSTALDEAYAGKWKRPAGHPDNQVWVHASAATTARPENTIISSPKGWYDAGDYNKYIVNSGISTYTILAAYEHFPEYYRNLGLDLPESNNTLPDILDEALWNLQWMLTMQDPNDGGVYHKLTTANFSGTVMPQQDPARRYVVQKSTPAALDFAAVLAQASRIFKNFSGELPGFEQTCLNAALNAWRWARKNPNVRYDQSALNAAHNPDINTGEYGDGNFSDEFQWAAAELFITTKADSFIKAYNPLASSFGVPWWGGVNTLGLYSLAQHRALLGPAIDTTRVVNSLLGLARGLRDAISRSAYHVVMGVANGDFVWGSNAVAANQSMALLQAYRLTRDVSFLNAAQDNLDYLLGRNAVGYCFVTGLGSKSTLRPHHRQSQADAIFDPVPGLLAGGPNPGKEDGCAGYIGTERARSYVDDYCSYASNEIAINWNAPLVYVAGAIEALRSPNGKPTRVQDRSADAPPEGFGVRQNYPNPFNPSTRIAYSLPLAGEVELHVYNLAGQLIRTLQDAPSHAGQYALAWHGDTDAGARVPSGVYLARLRLTANGRTWEDSKKMMVVW